MSNARKKLHNVLSVISCSKILQSLRAILVSLARSNVKEEVIRGLNTQFGGRLLRLQPITFFATHYFFDLYLYIILIILCLKNYFTQANQFVLTFHLLMLI